MVSATILRESTTQDADGHYETAPSTVASGVSGDLQALGGRLVAAALGPDSAAEFVFVPASRITSIREEDLLLVGSTYYRVVFVIDPGSTYLQEVLLRRDTDPAE